MNLRKITTRTMIAVLAAALLGLALTFTAIQGPQSATLSARHGIRAWLFMPKAFREFPAEESAGSGDELLYTSSAGPGSLRHWRLQIDTSSKHRDHWERAFSSYAVERRFECRSSHHRGPNKIYTQYRVPNGDYCWLKFEQAGGSENLQISFIYQRRPANRKLLKCMNKVAFRVRQLWRILRGDGFDFNAITMAS